MHRNHDKPSTRRAVVIGLACGGAAVGISGMAVLRRLVLEAASDEAVRVAQRRARPRIAKADADAQAWIEPCIQPFVVFFDEAKAHAVAFADDVLGWYSKYKLIRGQHEEFLAETFRTHFFGPDELRRAMTNAVKSYLVELESIDNQMLVDIRMDVADLPMGATLAALPAPDLQDRYRAACGKISGITGADAGVDAGRFAADMIVTSVITMMATRLTTSAAVLGAGAASGWWTFGLGLLIGVIVDQIIAAVWNWTYDPHGQLVAMMETKIDEIRRLVLDGEAGKPGLRGELRRYADQRATIRREAVFQLLADTSRRTGS